MSEDDKVSWLQVVPSNPQDLRESNSVRVGCVACAKQTLRVAKLSESASSPCPSAGPYAVFTKATVAMLKLGNLQRHEKSAGHKEAVEFLQGRASDACSQNTSGLAPGDTEWASVWGAMRKRNYMDMQGTESRGRGKSRKMQYCLAEALRGRQRVHLRQSSRISICMDGCKTRHMIRYVAVTPNLDVESGVLGLKRSKRTGHQTILQLTEAILRDAATMLAHAPVEAGTEAVKTPPTFDQTLYDTLRRNIQVWTSDAAADEQLAAKEAQVWRPCAGDVRPLLPNICLVIREKAHASRRRN